MGEEHISPRLMSFVTEPHVFRSKFTEILYHETPVEFKEE
jgi:hypothetical protein